MRASAIFAATVVAIVASRALAAPLSITVGTHALLPNTPNQHIPIYATGGDALNMAIVDAEISYFPNQFGDTVPLPGLPKITNLDLVTGTIFDGNTLSPAPGDVAYSDDQIWLVQVDSDGVPAAFFPNPGLIATLTISTVGLTQNVPYRLIMSANADFGGSFYLDANGDHSFIVTDGSIVVVPEPATHSILCTAFVALPAMIFCKRRRARRAVQ
jgi:hypothetical protein